MGWIDGSVANNICYTCRKLEFSFMFLTNLFYFIFLYSYLIQYIPIPASSFFNLPSLPHLSSLFRSIAPLFPFTEEQGLPGISTKHGITRCIKIRHKCSYKDQMRQPSRSKKIPKSRQKNQRHPHSHC